MEVEERKVKVLMVRKYEETQENGKWEELENLGNLKMEKVIGKLSVHEENGKRNSYGETEIIKSGNFDHLESYIL